MKPEYKECLCICYNLIIFRSKGKNLKIKQLSDFASSKSYWNIRKLLLLLECEMTWKHYYFVLKFKALVVQLSLKETYLTFNQDKLSRIVYEFPF